MVCVITRIGDNRKAYHTGRDIRDGGQGFRRDASGERIVK